MAKKIIIEVGQTFSIYDYDNYSISKVKCVADDKKPCDICVFDKTDTCDIMECLKPFRPDGLDVHFEYIKS